MYKALSFFEVPLLVRWTEVGMIGVKALDELLALDVFLVCRASIPEVRVTVDHEYLFALGCSVHGVSPAPAFGFYVLRPAVGAAGLVWPAL